MQLPLESWGLGREPKEGGIRGWSRHEHIGLLHFNSRTLLFYSLFILQLFFFFFFFQYYVSTLDKTSGQKGSHVIKLKNKHNLKNSTHL